MPWKIDFLWNCLKIFFGNFPRKSKYFGKLPKKSKFFGNLINLKNRNFLWNSLIKIEIFRKFALKNRFFVCEIAWKNLNFSEIFLENRNFLTRVHDPQISNQIDAAAHRYVYTKLLLLLMSPLLLYCYYWRRWGSYRWLNAWLVSKLMCYSAVFTQNPSVWSSLFPEHRMVFEICRAFKRAQQESSTSGLPSITY